MIKRPQAQSIPLSKGLKKVKEIVDKFMKLEGHSNVEIKKKNFKVLNKNVG